MNNRGFYENKRQEDYERNEGVKSNSKISFEVKTANVKDLNCITDERYEELKNISKKLRNTFINHDEVYIGEKYYAIMTYFFKSNPHYLKDYTIAEILTMTVQIVDPNLIYLDLSKKYSGSELEIQCVRTFGFYHPYLIRCEKIYAKRFLEINKEKPQKLIKTSKADFLKKWQNRLN